MSETYEKLAKISVWFFHLTPKAGSNLLGLDATTYQHKLQVPYQQISLAFPPPIVLNPKPHRFRKKQIKTNIRVKILQINS